ncbi:unnamed protein product [Cryptosporidium hominis]|uniref:Uncharacterized protein n=2 Tax=Cryptosporidium hominis TaxID=237895 RepID=A0A0S4TCW6_CRYHO|nr:hypothetical protein ChTU502y2012_389g0250 [Cryptosporidium hominis]PPA63749.1 hypothetical protein ChUKH1_09400 [Cryptosporidium hominis]PPS92849.1 Uncharacterized protein GY17_00002601 [Cryptosporidium hominis]CUV04917.1 unnamed protein product [Cryptosporidium hominis]|eukprot:PPS92849.1 Uncharacterized protein GY17_00002601 [Cryptosporidium hominis]
MVEVARRKVLGGRGSMGIVNSLRRKLIHLVNWELGTSGDEGSILNLLKLLLNSVGSEHFRSMTAIEIIQCLDNVMKVVLNKRTRSSWLLLLNNIGKSNVIFRDYILYCTLEILKDNDKSEILQNLDAKCIYWKLGNNFLYTLYSLILKDDTENDDVKRCMENCLSEGISPPRELLDLYLRRNSCRDLSLLKGFRLTSNLLGHLTYNLSKIESLNELKIQDYIEILLNHQNSLERKVSSEAIRNPFSNVFSQALINIIEKGENPEITDGFFHHLSLVYLVNSIDSSPWNLRLWKELLSYLKKVLAFLSLTCILDNSFNTEGGILRNLTISSISHKDFFQELISFFRFDFNIESDGNPDLVQLHKIETLIKSILAIRKTLTNLDFYWRYFNFKDTKNIQSEMQIVRFQVYSLLVLINHSNLYLNDHLRKTSNLLNSIVYNNSSESSLDMSFVLKLSEYNDLENYSTSIILKKINLSLFILPVSLLSLLESEEDAKSAFEAIQNSNAFGCIQNESFSSLFDIWNELEKKYLNKNGESEE